MRRALALGIALAGFALGPSLVGARAETDFRLMEFKIPGALHDGRVVDVDGDGLGDLLLLYTPRADPDAKHLRLCLQHAREVFEGAEARCRDTPLPSDARAFDIAPIDGDAGADLVLLTARGAAWAPFDPGEGGKGGGFVPFEALPDLPSVFAGTSPDKPARFRFLFNLDGDGRAALVLPTLAGPVIVRHRDGAFIRDQQLDSPASVTYRVNGDVPYLGSFAGMDDYQTAATTEVTAPVLLAQDFDGDGRIDIGTMRNLGLDLFLRGADGRYPERPSRTVERSILRGETGDFGLPAEAPLFVDLDGDGLLDLMLMVWGDGEQRTRMDRHLYFARPGLHYPEEADQVVRSESFFPNFEVRDLNGDGRRDLVVPYFHVAPSAAIKVVADNAVRIQLRLFLMRENGRYDQPEGKRFAKIDRRVALSYRIDVLGMLRGTQRPADGRFDPVFTFAGDFDGDGFADLAADRGDDRLRIFWGNDEARYANDPDVLVPFESSLDWEIAELGRDGRSSLIAYDGIDRERVDEETLDRFQPTRRGREAAEEQRRERAARRELGQEARGSLAPDESRVRLLVPR